MSIEQYKTPTPEQTDRILRMANEMRAQYIRDALRRLGTRISQSGELRFPIKRPSEV